MQHDSTASSCLERVLCTNIYNNIYIQYRITITKNNNNALSSLGSAMETRVTNVFQNCTMVNLRLLERHCLHLILPFIARLARKLLPVQSRVNNAAIRSVKNELLMSHSVPRRPLWCNLSTML